MNTYAGDPVGGLVLMDFTGTQAASTQAHGREYKGGTSGSLNQAAVHPDDVVILENSGLWRRAAVKQIDVVAPISSTETYRRRAKV